MGDRDEILEDLYALWVEAQVLHCVDQSGEESEEFGSDSNTVAETPFEGANSGTGPTSIHGVQLIDGPVDRPTGEGYQERVVRGNVENQSVDDKGFDPEQLWELLRQAGYETW